MKKNLILFLMRLFLYFSAASLVLLHPGILVSYDRIGIMQWFIVIPLASLLAFLPFSFKSKNIFTNKFFLTALVVLFLSFFAAGFSPSVFQVIFSGFLAFTLSYLLFHYPQWGKISFLEPFFLAWICIRLLLFSRSGETAAGESSGLTQFIMIWTCVIFLMHSSVIYLCLYPGDIGGIKKEAIILIGGFTVLLVLFIFFLPSDFISNSIVANFLEDRRDRSVRYPDGDWEIPEGQGGRREGRATIPSSREGREPGLRGLSEHEWPGGQNESQQYAIMVVASRNEPVYMGSEILGSLDPVHGFISSADDSLSRLSNQRFFVTWFDNERVMDLGRERWDVFSLSTVSQKFIPHRPYAIEPTVLNENSGPFRYIHNTVSNVHYGNPLNLILTPGRVYREQELLELASYLEVNLFEDDLEVFMTHLDRIIEAWRENRQQTAFYNTNEVMENVMAILNGFSDFQYHINTNNDASISDLVYFLQQSREGDCVEFSHTAALLGRLMGIPSRVVTGFVASESLQTSAHLRGLSALRSRIPVLQQFPFEDLFLVTDAHGHAWPQFFIPGYGWLDFEATAFAIPPIGLGDGNLRDVVIPLFDDDRLFSSLRAFPWRPVFRTIIFILLMALLAAYLVRYGRELYLYTAQRAGGAKGARSLYLLLLAKLAADGRPIKPASKTAQEYVNLFPGLEKGKAEDSTQVYINFAKIYTELRWKTFTDKENEKQRFNELKIEYRNIISNQKRKGLLAFLIRIFSLRGLAYL